MKMIKHEQSVCPSWFRFLSDHSSHEHNRLLIAFKRSEHGFPSVMKPISRQITKKQTYFVEAESAGFNLLRQSAGGAEETSVSVENRSEDFTPMFRT